MLILCIFILLYSNGLNSRKDVSFLYSRVGLLILTYCIISTYDMYYLTYIGKGLSVYNGLFNITNITQTFQTFIFISSLIILTLSSFYPRKIWGATLEKNKIYYKISLIINKMAEQYTIIEYALIILFIILGGTLLLSSGDFVSLFLGIELQSYGLYILCVIYRDSESATSSGLTYFLLGGLSSCFILLGIAFIYVNSGASQLDGFYVLTNLNKKQTLLDILYISEYITFSLLILSVGFLFKVGAAPFHFWSPDVYDGIPTIVTTFVANIAKISILVLMLDIVHYTSENINRLNFDWTTGLLISCLLSLLVGTILGLTQARLKRLLAYSTISHLGFILLALGVNSIESTSAFIFYLIQYILTNINAFIIILTIGFSLFLYTKDNLASFVKKTITNTVSKVDFTLLKDKLNSPIQIINQIKGYFYINPLISTCLTLIILSFIGLPPLVGFFAKQMVLSSSLDKGFIFLAFVSIITSVIGAVYYLNIIKTLFFEKNVYRKLFSKITLSNNLSLIITILTLLLLFFILISNEMINLSKILAILQSSSLFHPKSDDMFNWVVPGTNAVIRFRMDPGFLFNINNFLNSIDNNLISIQSSIESAGERMMNIIQNNTNSGGEQIINTTQNSTNSAGEQISNATQNSTNSAGGQISNVARNSTNSPHVNLDYSRFFDLDQPRYSLLNPNSTGPLGIGQNTPIIQSGVRVVPHVHFREHAHIIGRAAHYSLHPLGDLGNMLPRLGNIAGMFNNIINYRLMLNNGDIQALILSASTFVEAGNLEALRHLLAFFLNNDLSVGVISIFREIFNMESLDLREIFYSRILEDFFRWITDIDYRSEQFGQLSERFLAPVVQIIMNQNNVDIWATMVRTLLDITDFTNSISDYLGPIFRNIMGALNYTAILEGSEGFDPDQDMYGAPDDGMSDVSEPESEDSTFGDHGDIGENYHIGRSSYHHTFSATVSEAFTLETEDAPTTILAARIDSTDPDANNVRRFIYIYTLMTYLFEIRSCLGL